jgi:hypothetical protein
MRKVLLAATAVGMLMFSGGLSAAPLCTDATVIQNLGDLIANGGCTIQDKIFTFDASSYSGGGSVTADDVGVQVVFNNIPDADVHGWVFTPSGSWTTDFTISYAISVLPAFPDVSIRSTKLQINAGNTPGAPATTVNLTENGGALPPLAASFITAGDESDLATYAPVNTVSVVNSATIPGGKVLLSLENDFGEVTATTVPEPATATLFGGALIALSLLVRRYTARVKG